MLNLVLKTGDRIQIGDDVVIKLQSDSRAQLAIDAPREVSIKRLAAEPKAPKSVKSASTTTVTTNGEKQIYVVGAADKDKRQ